MENEQKPISEELLRQNTANGKDVNSGEYRKAACPNPDCKGEDSSFLVDDYTRHECDLCGTTWGSYDPMKKISECLNVAVRNLRPSTEGNN